MIYKKEKLEALSKRWLTPRGKKLVKIIKESRCYLNPVLFKEKIHGLLGMNDKEVANEIDLRGIHLSGLDFRVDIQDSDDSNFSECLAILSNIHFEGAILKHCNFEEGKIQNCYFENSDISHSNFKHSHLTDCKFQDSDSTGVNFLGCQFTNCDFNNTVLRDIILESAIVDQRSTFGHELRSEKEKNYNFAAIEYKQLKELYKNSSIHDLADRCHYRKMMAKRKTLHPLNPARWINYIFGDLLCKYGISFVRVLFWSAIVILGCASFFYISDSLFYYNADVSLTFLDALYFSTVTFSTLGYGDFHAIGAMRFVAAFESLIGLALMSLFTVIIARNIIRD